MGRPPGNGGPSFRFNHSEVVEMEAILQAHNAQMPSREVLDALAEKFSTSSERSGKVVVQMKQIWSWFQNRRYAIRAKAGKAPVKLTVSTPQNNSTTMKNVPLTPQLIPSSTAPTKSTIQNTKITSAPPVQDAVRYVSESQMEFEARSARDGAWYDVASFISHRSVETGDPGVLVRFAGFGPEEDEWVNVRKHVRQRSLPCEFSECIVVLPGDLILCFQEGKEQALYYDAHILDSQRRRHDMRGCRCRFLVRYDHDLSEEIVPLRKICRRPETDHRLQQLDAESGKVNQQRTGAYALSSKTTKSCPPTRTAQKDQKLDQTADPRANGTVALDVSQSITGSHPHSGHIAKVNQNSESTQPPVAETGLNSIVTHVLPATGSYATIVAKDDKVSEPNQLLVAEIGSDTVASHMLPSPDIYVADLSKINKISESTQPSVTETGSGTAASQMFPSPETNVADVEKVNQTSEVTQLQPLAETGLESIKAQVLPATGSYANTMAEVNQISESTQPPVAEIGSDTVATHMLPSPDSHAADVAKVSQTSEVTQLRPLAETGSDTVASQMIPTPEKSAVVIAAAASTQSSVPIPS